MKRKYLKMSIALLAVSVILAGNTSNVVASATTNSNEVNAIMSEEGAVVNSLKKPKLEYLEPSNDPRAITLVARNDNGFTVGYYLYEDGKIIRGGSDVAYGLGEYKYLAVYQPAAGVHEYQLVIFDEKGNTEKSDVVKVEIPKIIDAWRSGRVYETGEQVKYNNKVYECTYTHRSQDDWAPGSASALWKEV